MLDVAAPDALDSDKFAYRLAYVDAQHVAAYRDSRWTAPPAQLLTQRLRGALSSRGTVLEGSDGVRAPTLKVDLNEFEQVFDGQSQSHGAVTARATLMLDGRCSASARSLHARRPVRRTRRAAPARDGERPARVADRRVGRHAGVRGHAVTRAAQPR